MYPFRLEVYKKVGISQVEVYKRAEKTYFSVFKRAFRNLSKHLANRCVKGMPLSMEVCEGKGYSLLSPSDHFP